MAGTNPEGGNMLQLRNIRQSDRLEELTDRRNELVPQMAEYDRHASLRVWISYMMHNGAANFRSNVLNTDGYGFRYGRDPNGVPCSFQTFSSGDCNFLLGGSTTFCVGTTSDARTVSSRLSAKTGETWINCGMRAHVLAQNLNASLLLRPDRCNVKRLVALTGLNELYNFSE